MICRSHRIALVRVEFIARTMRPSHGGEMEVVGKEKTDSDVTVLLPHHEKTGMEDPYLVAFLNDRYGAWGLIDGARFKLISCEYRYLSGAIIKEAY